MTPAVASCTSVVAFDQEQQQHNATEKNRLSSVSLDIVCTSEHTYPAELSDSTPDEECSESHLSDEDDLDRTASPSAMAVGSDQVLPEQPATEIASSNTGRRSSILKRSESEPFSAVKECTKAWKRLPPPDIDALRRTMTLPCLDLADDSYAPRESMSVSFAQVQIRCYEQTVGDNPSVSYGPPITLDWDYEQMEPINIDAYEDARGKRRSLRQMVLSYYHRRNVLSWQYGVSDDELKVAKKQANKIKFERAVTQAFLPVMGLENAFESAGRKVRRFVKGSKGDGFSQ